MFNMGFTEMLAIAVIALVFIGPKQLPELARKIGAILGQFKRMSNDFQRELYHADQGIKKEFQSIERNMEFQEPPTFEVQDDGSSQLKEPSQAAAVEEKKETT